MTKVRKDTQRHVDAGGGDRAEAVNKLTNARRRFRRPFRIVKCLRKG